RALKRNYIPLNIQFKWDSLAWERALRRNYIPLFDLPVGLSLRGFVRQTHLHLYFFLGRND
ncbi:hypothetical protein QUA86_20690, partial [Microcoleus sp. F6_B6]